MVIGREEADITIEDEEISRRHAEVRQMGDGLEIEDLGSTNGTFVNGERVEGSRSLSGGDVVRVGRSELEFEAEAPAGGGTVVAAQPGGTSISQTPPPQSSSEPDQDATVRDAAVSGSAAGAPPSVESWSPAPTGSPGDAGAGAYSAPPAAGYTPPPAGGYTPIQGYGGQQGGQGYGAPQGGAPYQTGGYGSGASSSSGGKGSKGPLIAALLIGLLLIGAAAAYFLFLRPSDEDKVRDVVTEFGEKLNDPAVCDLVSQRYLEEVSGQTGQAAVDACRTDVEESGEAPIDVEITSVEINGDRATVQAEADGETGTFELVNEDGEWLIDNSF